MWSKSGSGSGFLSKGWIITQLSFNRATPDDNELIIFKNEGKKVLMQSFSNEVGSGSSSQVVVLAAHMMGA